MSMLCAYISTDAQYSDISIFIFDPIVESRHIWLSSLYCFGEESSLFDCPRLNQIGDNPCVHSEDIQITCYGKSLVTKSYYGLLGTTDKSTSHYIYYYAIQLLSHIC